MRDMDEGINEVVKLFRNDSPRTSRQKGPSIFLD